MKVILFFYATCIISASSRPRLDHTNLSRHGASEFINSGSKDGDTPLHLSIKRGYNNITRLLITNGASVNTADKDGDTPLHKAVLYSNPYVVNLLIERKANINVKNKEDETPLLLALSNENFELAKILIENGAELNYFNETEKNPLATAIKHDNVKLSKLFLENGVNVNDKVNGVPLIELAVTNACTDVTRLLLDQGANYTFKNTDGETLLYVALYNDFVDIAELLLTVKNSNSGLEMTL